MGSPAEAVEGRGMSGVDVDRLRELGDQPLPLFDPDAPAVDPVDLDEDPARLAPTVRQLQLLRLVTLGYSNPAIAKELWVTTDTVKTLLSHAFKRIGAKDRANAVAICVFEEWLKLEPTDTGFDVKVTVPERQIAHATNRGYMAHKKRKEKACRPCLDAHNEYQQAWVAGQARVAS